ncbi:unnamed protein product [Fusarium graminearum]|nr:hypothetical protein FG05_35428 [Fusarium graminearum]CZS80832.1 unnamed protein product [Fusarium graminearum]
MSDLNQTTSSPTPVDMREVVFHICTCFCGCRVVYQDLIWNTSGVVQA